jgi:hypothetical protein
MCFIGRISYASRKMPQIGSELQEADEHFLNFVCRTSQISNSPFVKTHSYTKGKTPKMFRVLNYFELIVS